MPTFNHMSVRGRKLCVAFECGRCGKTVIELADRQYKQAEGNLQCYTVPDGWTNDIGPYPFIMCTSCANAFRMFARNEAVGATPVDTEIVLT